MLMSTLLSQTIELSNASGCSIELCKLALERANNSTENAYSYLKKWGVHGQENKPAKSSDHSEQSISIGYCGKEEKCAVVIQLQCDLPNIKSSGELAALANNMAEELCQYDHYYLTDPLKEDLEKRLGKTITVSSAKIVKTNPLQLLTVYNHKKEVSVAVLTEASTEDALTSKEFKNFSLDCALHIAAFDPISIDKKNIPQQLKNKVISIVESQCLQDGKNITLWESIIEGKLDKWSKQRSMLSQIWIKSEKDTTEEIIGKLSSKLNSKIEIKQFIRF